MSRAVDQPFDGLTTYRGIVHTPECDENGHMNVQFYWAKFALADAQFAHLSGIDPVAMRRISRHIRYHAELHGANGLHIVSSFVEAPDGSPALLHQMIASDRGMLSATAFDRLDVTPAAQSAIRTSRASTPVPAKALPRSVTWARADFPSDMQDWAAGGAFQTSRTMIEPHLTGVHGELTDRGFVALSVEAAPQSWAEGGFTQDRLAALGLGRVALEKRLTIERRPLAGDLVHILTRFVAVERVTFSVRHHYYDSRSGAFLAACDVTLLPLDLGLRKSVALPDDVRDRIRSLITL